MTTKLFQLFRSEISDAGYAPGSAEGLAVVVSDWLELTDKPKDSFVAITTEIVNIIREHTLCRMPTVTREQRWN